SFAAAFVWFAISLGHPVLPGSLSAGMLHQAAFEQQEHGDLAAARQLLTQALKMKPLLWNGYFDRARLSLAMGLPPQAALEDFARARYLEPNNAAICNTEALIWMHYYPKYSVPAWRIAMERDRPRALSHYFSTMCSLLNTHPELRSAVRDLATEPSFKLYYLGYSEGEDFTTTLKDLLQLQPTLGIFTPEDRLQLFRLWYAKGNRAELLDALESHSDWRTEGWPVLVTDRVDKGDLMGACQLAMENLQTPIDGTTRRTGDIETLRRNFLFHSNDYTYGLDLYEAEKAKNLINDALVTLEKLSQFREVTQRVNYEQALMLMRKHDFANAWDKLRVYIQLHEISERVAREESARDTRNNFGRKMQR
ncbi:MAG: hypothetical protein WCN98_18995, partial [Verrucomicrobiaceae bacterium]